MSVAKTHVCPAAGAGFLDTRIRGWFQNPRKILAPYIREGMTAVDIGCGPGFFSLPMAEMVGKTGRVIACDLQEGMLQRLRKKTRGTNIEERLILHQCEEDHIGLAEKADFVLAFYMVHEVPDKERFLSEIRSILKPGGRLLIVEPPLHVSRAAFEVMIRTATGSGFVVVGRPKMFANKTVLLQNG